MEEWEFWQDLVSRINRVLGASRDNNIRFLGVEDIIPDMPASRSSGESILGTAFMLGDDRGSDRYRVTLSLNPAAADAYRAGEFSKLLPDPGSDAWLEISSEREYIRLACAL